MTPTAGNFPTQVLVVDDEQSVIDLLTVVLKKAKLSVRSATSGEDALKLLEAERFGCMLCDKNLPGRHGLDVIREAKRLQPYCACLVMTGYPTAESVLEALRLGATDYLEKPFPELGLVVQRVQSAMEHARTAFEREALVRTLREMRTRLKKTEEAVFQRQTELDVFVQVLELRVEEATGALNVKTAQLQAELDALREQLKAHATRAALSAQRPNLTLEEAREALENLERSLSETVDALAR
ncbi:MAG: response regulator [Myxococcaceae bacterium]|nr:response regulator [Myxococcaceae bacterium]